LPIHLEAQAKLYVQKEILQGTYELAWSYVMDFENSANPYNERKTAISSWRNIAVIDIDVSDEIVEHGSIIMQKGIKKKDALHLACAIKAECDYFLTTDGGLLNKVFSEITVINPLDFIRRLEA